MRVVQLLKANFAATWARQQVAVLKSEGIDVHVILPARHPGDAAAEFREMGVPVHDIWLDITPRNPLGLLKDMARLRKVLAGIRPHIVHSHYLATTVLLRLVGGHSVPYARIFEVHGPLHLEHTHTRLLDLLTVRPPDYVIATSKVVQRLYQNHGFDMSKLAQIYFGTTLHLYVRPRSGKLRKELGITEDQPLIGMVAWIYPPKRVLGERVGLKGHDLFIAAAPLILQRVPDAHFVVIGGQLYGGDGYFRKLKSMVDQLSLNGRFHMLGARSDVPELYPDLDIAVHPSRSDNVGGAVESFLANVPTVAANVGGLPELVIDGVTGLLFPKEDPVGLANCVVEMLSDKERARCMTRAGQELTLELFDIEKTARRVAEIYRYILHHRGLKDEI